MTATSPNMSAARAPSSATSPAGSLIRSVSRRTAARIAGAGYLAIFVLAIFANFIVREGLIVAGDAAATVANITDSIGLFRAGVVAFVLVFVLDVIIAWALHIVFREVNADLSLAAAWLRLVYTVFLGVAVVFLFEVLQLLGSPETVAALGSDQVAAHVMLALGSFDSTWLVGLVAFGIHLGLLGYLILRSGVAPKLLGWLLIAAGVAYVIDTLAHALVADYAAVEAILLVAVAVPSVIGEGWFGLWLLFGPGRRTQLEPASAG